MRHTLSISLFVLVCAACSRSSKPTIGKLKHDHPEAVAAIQGATNKAFATLLDTPAGAHQATTSKCEAKLGEKLEVIALHDRFGAGPGEVAKFDFYSGDGPVGLWASRLQTDDESLTDDKAGAELEAATKVKHVLVQKRAGMAQHYDLFLVELPSGNVVCGFGVEEPERAEYNAETGDEWSSDLAKVMDTHQERLDAEAANQIALRFGGPAKTAAAAPSKAEVDARAFYKKVADGLAVAELPECTDADPAGAVKTTVKRLRVYAGLPLLARLDHNRDLEPAGVISPAFKDLVDPAKRDKRDATIASLRAAPATIVVDVLNGRAAIRRTSTTYEGGYAKARAVRFDTAGDPKCQRVVEVWNPEQMNFEYASDRGADIGLIEASEKDLRQQLTAKL